MAGYDFDILSSFPDDSGNDDYWDQFEPVGPRTSKLKDDDYWNQFEPVKPDSPLTQYGKRLGHNTLYFGKSLFEPPPLAALEQANQITPEFLKDVGWGLGRALTTPPTELARQMANQYAFGGGLPESFKHGVTLASGVDIGGTWPEIAADATLALGLHKLGGMGKVPAEARPPLPKEATPVGNFRNPPVESQPYLPWQEIPPEKMYRSVDTPATQPELPFEEPYQGKDGFDKLKYEPPMRPSEAPQFRLPIDMGEPLQTTPETSAQRLEFPAGRPVTVEDFRPRPAPEPTPAPASVSTKAPSQEVGIAPGEEVAVPIEIAAQKGYHEKVAKQGLIEVRRDNENVFFKFMKDTEGGILPENDPVVRIVKWVRDKLRGPQPEEPMDARAQLREQAEAQAQAEFDEWSERGRHITDPDELDAWMNEGREFVLRQTKRRIDELNSELNRMTWKERAKRFPGDEQGAIDPNDEIIVRIARWVRDKFVEKFGREPNEQELDTGIAQKRAEMGPQLGEPTGGVTTMGVGDLAAVANRREAAERQAQIPNPAGIPGLENAYPNEGAIPPPGNFGPGTVGDALNSLNTPPAGQKPAWRWDPGDPVPRDPNDPKWDHFNEQNPDHTTSYRTPDGEIVQIRTEVARGAETMEFGTADGPITITRIPDPPTMDPRMAARVGAGGGPAVPRQPTMGQQELPLMGSTLRQRVDVDLARQRNMMARDEMARIMSETDLDRARANTKQIEEGMYGRDISETERDAGLDLLDAARQHEIDLINQGATSADRPYQPAMRGAASGIIFDQPRQIPPDIALRNAIEAVEGRGAPDIAYRDVLPDSLKTPLQEGESWRTRAMNLLLKLAKETKGEFEPEEIINAFRRGLKRAKAINWGDTRFILPDGTRLTHNDWTHSAATEKLGIGLEDALGSGIVRVTHGFDGAEIWQPITEAQANMLADGPHFSGRDLNIDQSIPGPRGRFLRVKTFPGGTSANKIREWVNRGYRDPEGTLERLFRGEEGSFDPMTAWKNYKEWSGTGQGRSRAKKPKAGVDEYNFVREALTVPTSATTMADLSYPGRQGLPNILYPEFWTAANKAFGGLSEAGFDQIDAYNRSLPVFRRKFNPTTGELSPSIADRAGYKLSVPASKAGRRSELVASRWLETGAFPMGPEKVFGMENVPRKIWSGTVGKYLIRPTNRFFITYGNTLGANRMQYLFDMERHASAVALKTGEGPMEGVLGGFNPSQLRAPILGDIGKKLSLPDVDIGFKRKYTREEALAMDPYQNMDRAREIADFVRTTTGQAPLRGHVLPHKSMEIDLEGVTKGMGMVFYSPGMLASRMRMIHPSTYIMASPFVRKQYLKSALGAAAGWWAFTHMAKTAADAFGIENEIVLDVTNPDFGKFRMGNLRLDFGAGFLQWAVLLGRAGRGGWTSSSNPQVGIHPFGQGFQPETQGSNLQRFTANKLNPANKFAYDWLWASESQPFHIGDRTAQMFVPLFGQDLWETAKENPELVPWLVPVVFGAGTQNYGRTRDYIPEKGEYKFVPPDYDWILTGKEGLFTPWDTNPPQ